MPHRDWSNVGVFYLFGGGHSDGSCNAVIKFDATALTYSVVIPPTPPADYPPAFTAPNSSIVYPSGSSTDYFQTTATLTDSRDIPYAAPFVAPQASHGYSGIVAYNNKLQVYYGRSTTADLVAKTWDVSSLNRYGVQIHTIQPNDGGNALQEGTHAVVDKVTGKTWVTANPGSAGNNWRV
jgi:hypothetical protein